MGKPSKQQIAEARKRGIVPGAECKSGWGTQWIVGPSQKWAYDPSGDIADDGHEEGPFIYCTNKGWATVITPAPSQPRIKGRFAAKPKEPTQLDRIEGYLNKVGQVIVDQGREFKSKLSAIESSVTERLDALRMEQYALAQDTAIDPLMNNGIVAPLGLQPGDYCDASKEVADELTAMWGRTFIPGIKQGYKYFEWYKSEAKDDAILVNTGIPGDTHLDAPTFLSRARVTAKELGLKPVEAPAEVCASTGDWLVITDHVIREWTGKVIQAGRIEPFAGGMHVFWGVSDYGVRGGVELRHTRPATEAEIAAHLAAEEAKRKEAERAQKVKALKFGVRVMTPEGSEGVYINTPAVGGCRIAFPSGHVRNYTLDQLTPIEP
jgi:hypothetical protein